MNEIQNRIPRIKFSGRGARVSHLGNQVFVEVPKTPSPVILHALWVYEASTGSTPQVGVTPGGFNGSIVPTINGNPINVQIGMPLAYPVLTCTPGDQVAYFEIDYNSSNVLTAVKILSGTFAAFAALQGAVSIVQGTAGMDYYQLSTITAVAGPPASISPLNDFVSGPQNYTQCLATGTSSCSLK